MEYKRRHKENPENETVFILQYLDDVLKTGRPFEEKIDGGYAGSVHGFSHDVDMGDSSVLLKDKIAVVNQGSYAFFPNGSVSTVLSPDFTRCVGLVIRKPEGILVAHATEYDGSLLEMYSNLNDDKKDIATFFLPDTPSEDVDISDTERKNLKKLRESITLLTNDHVQIHNYPWSDFPPGTNRSNEGYTLKVSKADIEIIHTRIVEDETALGYHHEPC